MSHITTVQGVNIVDKQAFIDAMTELGVSCKENSTIHIYDGRNMGGVVSATITENGQRYSIGLVADGDKFKLVGDFQCFGWNLPTKFVEAMRTKGCSDKDIQDCVLRYTTAHTMKRAAEAEGYAVEFTYLDNGNIELEMTGY